MPDSAVTVPFMGLTLDALTMEQVLGRVEQWIAEGTPHEQVSINVLKVAELDASPDLRTTIEDCDLKTVDGAGVLLTLRVLGKPVPQRIPGVDLFLALMERAAERGWRPYLLGAAQQTLDRVVAHYAQHLPSLELAGARNGFFDRDEEADIVDRIASSEADLLFIAMGSPRTEQFIGRWKHHLGVPYIQGVGGSFDVVAGHVRRAPAIVQRLHLEWAWRTALQPRLRLARVASGALRYSRSVVRDEVLRR